METPANQTDSISAERPAVVAAFLFFLFMALSQAGAFEQLYSSTQHDLRAYVACAHNILADRHIYQTHHQAVPEDPTLTADVPKFLYPPLLGMLMIPLSPLSYDTIKHIWFFANFFFILHGIFLAVSILPLQRFRLPAFFVLAALSLGSDAFSWLLRTAQVDGFALYLSLLALYFFHREKWAAAALFICMASWVKVTPGIFFIYLLTRGPRRFAIQAVIAGIMLGLAQIATVQGEFFYFFTNTISEDMPSALRPPSMQSLHALCQLLLVPFRGAHVFDAPQQVESLLLALKIAVSLAAVAVMLRRREGSDGLFAGFAVCSAVSLLVTDVSWMMRFSWNVITAAAILCFLFRVRNRAAALVLFPVGALILLLDLSSVWKGLFGPLVEWKALFIAGPSLHALLATVILLGISLHRSQWSPFVQKSGELLVRIGHRLSTGSRTQVH